jgi:hypothetical protein
MGLLEISRSGCQDIGGALRMLLAGVETASRYTYEAFRDAWLHELDLFLSN